MSLAQKVNDEKILHYVFLFQVIDQRRKERGPDSFELPKYETEFGEPSVESKELADVIEDMLTKVTQIQG